MNEQQQWENTWGPDAWHRRGQSIKDEYLERGVLAKVLMALGARSTFGGLLMFFLIPLGAFAGIRGGLVMVAVGAVIGWAIAFGLGHLLPVCRYLLRHGIGLVRRRFSVDYDAELRKVLAGKNSKR